MRAALDFGSFKATNAADPTNPQDLATKNYVDVGAPYVSKTNGVIQGSVTVVTGAVSFSSRVDGSGNIQFVQSRSGVETPIATMPDADGPFNFLQPLTIQGVSPVLASQLTAGSNVNGYWVNRPDGNGGVLVEQWGSVTVAGSDGWGATFDLPTPFTNMGSANIIISTSTVNAGAADGNKISARITALDKWQVGNDDTQPTTANWRAIGY